ncbi:head maturation protease, ClpP-related [Spongiibacter tropicus]|uniref:head maturation protease, ClpP-related n=1 Tax=Spongiibacter tropicus TaxID=454602 RepID=UPI0003B469E8|nr:head maturation protease, ClpP-related [Spongiibacter tropicus]
MSNSKFAALRPQASLSRGDIRFDLIPKALESWSPGVRAAGNDENSISIFDAIGEDYWTGEGVTAKRISAALRSIGDRDVVVNINSPGGDMFEGLAIYSLLKEHPGNVTVRILGLAASAASIIAMAGDDIQIARAGFLMIHNAWICVCGNRNDLREFAEYLEPFDQSMADIYTARTGEDIDAIKTLMDAETWIGGQAAIEQGFATALLPSDAIEEDESPEARAVAKVDLILAKAGMPRSQRRQLIKEIKTSTPSAAGGDTPGAITPDMQNAVVSTAGAMPRLSFSV